MPRLPYHQRLHQNWLNCIRPCLGREIIYPGILYPQLVDYITYDQTDILQAPHHIVLCCPANLETNSAAFRFIFCEYDVDAIFQIRPEVGNVLTLPVVEIKLHQTNQTNQISFVDN